MKFDKPSLNTAQHIALLKDRGLSVPDEDKAARYLQAIGYYRLSAYFLPYQNSPDVFNQGTEFDDILNLYIADRKLRILCMDALERIEVSVRSAMSNIISEKHGPHWYLNRSLYKDSFLDVGAGGKSEFDQFIKCVETNTGKYNARRRNTSCDYYYNKYTDPPLPPCWMIIEVLTMGTWSRIYSELRHTKIRKKISEIFSFEHKDFGSWIHALTLIRNTCAHHARLWNYTFPPKARNIENYTHPGIPLNTPYENLALIQGFLSSFTNQSTWSKRLHSLLSDWPLDIYTEMKFPAGWEDYPFWRIFN